MDSHEAARSYKQAEALYAQHRFQEALAILEVLNENFPNTKNIMYPLALCLIALKRNDDASAVCDALEEAQDPRAQALRAQLNAQPAQDDLGLDASLLDNLDRPAPKRVVVVEESSRLPLYIGIAAALAIVIGALVFTGAFSKLAGAFKKETPEEAIAKVIEAGSKLTGCTGVFQAEGKLTQPAPMKITASGDFDFVIKDGKTLYKINAVISADAMPGMNQTILSVSDGSTAFMEMNVMGQTMVMKVPAQEGSQKIDPTTMLSELKKMGNISMEEDEMVDSAPAYVFTVKPTAAPDMPPGMPKVGLIKIVVEKNSGIPARVEINDEAGAPMLTANLKDIVPNSSSSPDKFKYTPPANVPVMDLADIAKGGMPFPVPGM